MVIDWENDSGYELALKAAGAEVVCYKEFGSYQGDWLAKVNFEGETFWIRDYFGSCSVCDAFEGDVGYNWNDDPAETEKYREKVREFGARLLEPQERLTSEAVENAVSENIAWDGNAQEMVDFVRANA
jgi:hypothetical protein